MCNAETMCFKILLKRRPPDFEKVISYYAHETSKMTKYFEKLQKVRFRYKGDFYDY